VRTQPYGRFADGDSLHKRRRIWRSRRARPASCGPGGPWRCRSSSARCDRTRAPADPSLRNRHTAARGRRRSGALPVLLRSRACGEAHRRCNARGWRHSARAYSRPGTGGSSCRAGLALIGARRSRIEACAVCSGRKFGWARRPSTRTYVLMAVGHPKRRRRP